MFKEENATKKHRENSLEAQNHTCPNPMCGKTFTKPLKAENLSSGAIVVYEACPYCLTEITIKEDAPSFKRKTALAEENLVEPEPEVTQEMVASPQQPSTETSNCKHYFGYLSERSSRDKLPEECMVCPNIVQCMLKGVTG